MKDKYFNLQLFADEGDGAGAGDGNGGGSEGSGEKKTESKPPSFDDFLKGDGNQAEFDRRVQQAIKTATDGLEDKFKTIYDTKVSEAEKLAKMNKEEKAAYTAQKEREAFEAEKAEFAKKQLLVAVKEELQKETLPTVFAESIVAIGDAEKIKDAVAELKNTWDAEIAEAIKASVRQKTPQEGGQSTSGNYTPDLAGIAKAARIIK